MVRTIDCCFGPANTLLPPLYKLLGMSYIDWGVLLITLIVILVYGSLKGRGQRNVDTYLMADRALPWYMILLGIMATQASAITFLSAPGQAYTDGMRFIQYYFGLPLAMIVICVTFIPIFQRLKVYTAYEFLEQRFDQKTRKLTAFLFLISRGLSTGISIYAPSIILSTMLDWNIYICNILTGGVLLIYTYMGGAKAIAHTQKFQFLIILASMGLAAFLLIQNLPGGASFRDALYLAGKSGKLNVITTDLNWDDKYNLWSGIIGGFFLALSYFGTDQSQVGRYITAKDTGTAKKGLLLNGLVKIPMQFAILLIGALVFAFFTLRPAPIYFNERTFDILETQYPKEAAQLNAQHDRLQNKQLDLSKEILRLKEGPQEKELELAIQAFKSVQKDIQDLHTQVEHTIKEKKISIEKTDTNYIFLYFVKNILPPGMMGLLFAVIFLASWGSISAALNGLAASSLKDIHLSSGRKQLDEKTELLYGRLHTLAWTLFSIAVAMFATQMGSLIEAVNVLGSLFYGPILGIFLVAFYFKRIKGSLVFYAAIASEILVIAIYGLDLISFLWLNVVGVLGVIIFAYFGHWFSSKNELKKEL